MRVIFKDVFGLAEHQEKTFYGLRYILTLTRNVDRSVLNKSDATIVGINKISNEWYVPHYIPSTPQQVVLSKQNLGKTPTRLQYVERRILMKEVNTQNLITFEVGTQGGKKFYWIFVPCQQRDRQDSKYKQRHFL